MKKLFFALALLFSTAAFAQQNPYTGSWQQTNLEHLSGAQYINAIAVKFTIKSNGSSLDVQRTSLTGNPQAPETVSSESFDLNSKAVKTVTDDKRTKTLTVTPAADQRAFKRTVLLSAPDKPESNEVSVTEDWSLSADGKTLTIDKAFKSLTDANDQWTVKATYARQD